MRNKYRSTNPEHEKIKALRMANYSYGAIAEMMGLAKNTVQSICQRAGIRCTDIPGKIDKNTANAGMCKNCGELFVNPWNRKDKTFCSDKCRSDWWNERRRLGNTKKNTDKTVT